MSKHTFQNKEKITYQRRWIKVQTKSEEKIAYSPLNRRGETDRTIKQVQFMYNSFYQTVAVHIGGENLYSGVGDEKHFQT